MQHRNPDTTRSTGDVFTYVMTRAIATGVGVVAALVAAEHWSNIIVL